MRKKMAVAALLRGINVGGTAKIGMAELRSVLAGLGLGEVRTYLQSGNVILPEAEASERVTSTLEAAIAGAFGTDVRVLLRDRAEMASIAASHPFGAEEPTPAKLHVVFLRDEPEQGRIAALDPDRSPPDRFHVDGRQVYLHFPNGSGRSKLTLDYFERVLCTVGTARNWNTVSKLNELMG